MRRLFFLCTALLLCTAHVSHAQDISTVIDSVKSNINNSDVKEALLGYTSSGNVLTVTEDPAPYVGFGYIRKMRDNSSGSVVDSYEGWWYYRVQFSITSEETRTKERSIEWRTPTLSGRGTGVQLASGETLTFAVHESFATLAAAKSWLNGKAGIT